MSLLQDTFTNWVFKTIRVRKSYWGFLAKCLPSLAFFLLAKVPPSFPRNESSFFLEEGDLGVGDFGEDGDF